MDFLLSKCHKMSTLDDYAQSQHVVTVNLGGIQEIAEAIVKWNGHAPAIFKEGKRANAKFLQTQILEIDFDSGFTIEQAKESFKNYTHVVAATKSHQKLKNGVICDRFRVLLFFSEPITDAKIYQNTWYHWYKKFPKMDAACKDLARFYSKSTEVISINETGEFITPIFHEEVSSSQAPLKLVTQNNERGRLSRATNRIINEGVFEEGSRNISMFKAAVDCGEQGYSFDETVDMLSGKSSLQPNEELKVIRSGWGRKKYPPRINTKFPVTKTNSSGNHFPDPNHPDNLKFLVKNVMKLNVSFNELKNRIYLNNNSLNDHDFANVRLRAREYNLSSSKDFIEDVIIEIARENSYHPFKGALENTKWDGKDHISELFQTLEIEDEHLENKSLYREFLKRWLIGVIAKVYSPGSQNLVLTFKGGQGIGKSRWLEKLAIAPEIYGEGAVNPDDKDHVLRHLNYNIWHVSELDGVTRKKDQSSLKDYFTKQQVAVREPYGRFDRIGSSQLSFCASVNEESFLLDQTGNRRFLIIPLKNINTNHNVNMLQVFAQAKALFDQGTPHWFENDEITTLNKVNETFLMQNHVDFIASKIKPGSTWVSAQELFQIIDSNFRYSPNDLVKLGLLLRKAGISSARKKINGVKLTMYQVTTPKIGQ